MIKKLAPKDAFTLIEMMVVVAITALILVVAIPNFRSYQARAKQNEAKLGLSSIYAVEQTFLTDTSTYTSCLLKIGFKYPNSLERYYAIGLHSSAGSGATCGKTSTQTCERYSNESNDVLTESCASTDSYYAENASVKSGFSMYTNVNSVVAAYSGTGMSRFLFTAGAGGNVSEKNTGDEWIIDQNKTLINTVSGL